MREKCFGAGSPLSSSREGRRRLGEPLPHQLADNRLPAQSTHQKPRQRRGFRKHLWYRLFVSDIALPSHRSSFVALVDESKCFGDWMAGTDLRHVLVRFCFSVFHSLMTTIALAIDHLAHQPAHSSNPKTFPLKIPRCSGTEQQTIPVRSPLRVLYPPRVTHLPQSHWAPFQFARSAPGDLLLD